MRSRPLPWAEAGSRTLADHLHHAGGWHPRSNWRVRTAPIKEANEPITEEPDAPVAPR